MKLYKLMAGTLAICPFAFGTQAFAGGDKGEHGHGADAAMKMMDTNGDGKVSADEHSAGARKMFETMDGNKDGTVTAAEMSSAGSQMAQMMGKKTEKGEMTAAEKIKKVDLNNDGMLTAKEHNDASKAMFDKMDTNKDGYLTKDGIAAGHKQMMHKASMHEGGDHAGKAGPKSDMQDSKPTKPQ